MRRFSVRSLMAFVFVCAIGLAALRAPVIFGVASCCWSPLPLSASQSWAAVVLRGLEKYWWAGFAFFGGGYLALAFGPWLSDTFQPQLGTTHLLEQLRGRMHPSVLVIQVDLGDSGG